MWQLVRLPQLRKTLLAVDSLPKVAVGRRLLPSRRRSYDKLEATPASGSLQPGHDVGAPLSDIERVHGEDMDG